MAKDLYSELKSLFSIPHTLGKIEKRQVEIEKMLDRLIRMTASSGASATSRGAALRRKKAAPKPRVRGKAPAKAKRKVARAGKKPMTQLIASVMKGKKRGLTVAEIHDTLIGKKMYTGKSTNLKNLISVTLYRNLNKLYKRVGPGKFTLA